MSYLWSVLKRIPVLLCIGTPVAIFITYGMAVGLGHVHPLLPYISDTGTKPPESCLFSIFLSSSSFVLCILIYVRYMQVSEFIKLTSPSTITPFWNRVSAALGYLSCLGLDLVACFQQSNQFVVHIIGAMMCFVSATAFFLFQTIFTRKMYPKQKCLLCCRAAFTFLSLAFLIGTFLPVKAALRNFKGNDVLYWSAEDGGYLYHLISTFSEWFLVFSFCAYICTFQWDFCKIIIHPPVVKFLELEKGPTKEEI